MRLPKHPPERPVRAGDAFLLCSDGLTNVVTPDEIGEVLLHCAVYCGVPAANGAFAIAQRVIDDNDGESGT